MLQKSTLSRRFMEVILNIIKLVFYIKQQFFLQVESKKRAKNERKKIWDCKIVPACEDICQLKLNPVEI